MDTFTPPVPPTAESAGEIDFATETIAFGNGWEQSTDQGLNARRERFSLSWTSLSDADYGAIIAFCDAHRGSVPFLYTVPRQGIERQWKIVPPVAYGFRARGVYHTLRLSIRECFDPQ